MDCSLPGSSIHGIFQARVLEWGAIAFSVKSTYLLLMGEGERVLALESREGTRASRRVEEGLSRTFSGGGAGNPFHTK